MLDVYQEMLPNCVRLLVPVEKKTEVKGVGSVGGRSFPYERASILISDTKVY